MSDKYCVKEFTTLLPFLQTHLHNWARNKIKQRLQTGCVSVNGLTITQHSHPLKPNDFVEIGAVSQSSAAVPAQLNILYSDRNLIAIDKPAGLLSVGNTKETKQHALAILRKQLSRKSQEIKLWPVHRIDRDTSGVLLFATSREIREAVMAKWDRAEKTYLAIVDGVPNPSQGRIDQPLRLDEVEYRVHVGEHPDAKPALTHYKILNTTEKRALLEVQIDTGRQHQIRAHLSWLGYPVVGDERYGKAGERMGLHAQRLKIINPNSGKELLFESAVPLNFTRLLV
ncbi:MAG: RluA family pseudouridine synthase [Gammaproteobacteria bacterium]|nr:MAG: RluA family pseudouridine synthase [Gammaproteobacteria bacterium]